MSYRCAAITHNSTQCLRYSLENSQYCWQHYDMFNDTQMEESESDSKYEYKFSDIESDLIEDIINPMFRNIHISEDLEESDDTSMLIPDLESIVGSYLDIQSFKSLSLYNPKTHNIAQYILESSDKLFDSIKLDNLNLFQRFLNNKPISSEILDSIIQNDSIEIFKSVIPKIQISDTILESIFYNHAFKIATYLSTLEQYSRRKKFFFYVSVFKVGLIRNDLILTQFFVNDFKLNIRNNLNGYLSLSKNNTQIYNYLLKLKSA